MKRGLSHLRQPPAYLHIYTVRITPNGSQQT